VNHLSILVELKFSILKNAFYKLRRRSKVEFFTLILFFLGAAGGLFLFFYQSFRFFRNYEPFGPILIDETLYLFNFALFVMLLISSGVSAFMALFRSDEVSFLLTLPVSWFEIYFIKLTESLWFSSWSILFIAIPFMTAYGINKDVRLVFFPVLCLIFYSLFVTLAAMLGALISTIITWILPDQRRRRLALIFVVLAVLYIFASAEPELIKEQGSIAGILSGYLPHITFAKNPFLPSSWVTHGILALTNFGVESYAGWREGFFYFTILASNVLFFLIPSYSVASKLYPQSYLKAQDHGRVQQPRHIRVRTRIFEKFLDRLRWPSRPAMAFLEKDLKTFVREPSEWTQLIIFFGLLLLYFANLKNLEFHILKDFWKHLVFVLNTVGTYIVLSSFSMRFVFPMLSLEGSRSWIIGLAPIRFSSLLMEKFFLGTFISGILTLPLVFLSGWMLNIPLSRILFTTGLGFFVCVALTGLSVGLEFSV